jgi:hypothetical protein
MWQLRLLVAPSGSTLAPASCAATASGWISRRVAGYGDSRPNKAHQHVEAFLDLKVLPT